MFKSLSLAAALLLAGHAGAASGDLAGAATYRMDPNHTEVLASWSHFGFSTPTARFGQAEGTIVYDPDHVGQSSVRVTLPLSGLDTGIADLDEHLRSADFFDAARYPEITFVSTRVEPAGDRKLRVFGELTVHGVTRAVVLDTTLNRIGEHPLDRRAAIGFNASTTLRRSDFGIDAYVPGVSDEIAIRITTEALVPGRRGLRK